MNTITSTSADGRDEGSTPPAAAKTNAIHAETTSDDFYSGAVGRIRNYMIILALLLTVGAWWRFGRWSAMGCAMGCAIAFLNFHWLKRGVSGLADRMTNASVANPAKSPSRSGIVARFLLRYVLLAAAAYVILTSFPASLRGLFTGLCLPVGAIACEAVYELYKSF